MKYYVIKPLNCCNHVTTIVYKGNSDVNEWRNNFIKPFELLDDKTIYTAVYAIFTHSDILGYATKGTPQNLYKRFLEKLDNSLQFMITIINKDMKKEQWFFSIQ